MRICGGWLHEGAGGPGHEVLGPGTAHAWSRPLSRKQRPGAHLLVPGHGVTAYVVIAGVRTCALSLSVPPLLPSDLRSSDKLVAPAQPMGAPRLPATVRHGPRQNRRQPQDFHRSLREGAGLHLLVAQRQTRGGGRRGVCCHQAACRPDGSVRLTPLGACESHLRGVPRRDEGAGRSCTNARRACPVTRSIRAERWGPGRARGPDNIGHLQGLSRRSCLSRRPEVT